MDPISSFMVKGMVARVEVSTNLGELVGLKLAHRLWTFCPSKNAFDLKYMSSIHSVLFRRNLF